MDLTSGLALDWQWVDDLRDVQLLPKTSAAAPTGGGVAARGLRRAIDRSELALTPVLATKENVVWHLWKYHLGATVPKRLDVVLDEVGGRWVIQTVQIMDEGQRYRLTTSKEQ